MPEKKYPQGIRFYMPSPKAPSFVKGVISIYADEACKWIQEHAVNGKLRIDLLESQFEGKEWYLNLDEYQKPQESVSQTPDDDIASAIPF